VVDRRLIAIVLSLTLSVLAASGAYADLIEGDLVSSGDGLITKDTATGLEWLDLTATLDQEFDEVTAGSYYTTHGFTHATNAQIETLFLNAATGATLNADSGSMSTVPNGTAADVLLDLLGQTGSRSEPAGTFLYGLGYAGDGPTSYYWSPWYGKTSGSTLGYLITGTDAGYGDGTAWFDMGHYLVRAVPEPTTAALLGLGLLLVFGRARRLRRAAA
jgi:hypothetical protein